MEGSQEDLAGGDDSQDDVRPEDEIAQIEPPRDDASPEDAAEADVPPPDTLPTDGSQPVLKFKSHIEGRNADVEIWPDRIEWRHKTFVPLKKHDTNLVPIRMIEGVTTHRAGLRYTLVRVVTAGNALEFRTSKYTADAVKSTLAHLISKLPGAGSGPGGGGAAAAGPPQSVADELSKLAELRETGVLSEKEFEAQKERLLNPPAS